MLDSYTTLGFLAGVTERVRLGTLVTGVTYRNVAHLAKIVATLDVAVRRPGDLRPRARPGSSASTGLRLGLPAAGRALRAARGRAGAAAADVGAGIAAFEGRTTWCPRRSAIRGRCRSTSRSSSAAPASGGRCGSSRSTPTPATCSATRRRCATRSTCCASTAPPRGATRRTIAVTHLAPARVVAPASRARGRARPPRRSTSAASASSPRLASRRRSSACRTAAGACVGRALRRGRRGLPRVKRRLRRRCSPSSSSPRAAAATEAAEAPHRDRRERAADGDDHPARRRPAAARRALPPRLGREPAALLPAVARAPGARGQRRDLPALPGLRRRAAAAGARQRARRRAPRRSRAIDEDPRSLVVAGHSAGGALAADYAVIARSVGLPGAASRCSAPTRGGGCRALPFGIPEVDPARIPAATRADRARRHARPGGRHAAGAAARPPGGRAQASAGRRQRPGRLGPPRPAAGRRGRAARVLGAPGPAHPRGSRLSRSPT